jgi:hypothetical protein
MIVNDKPTASWQGRIRGETQAPPVYLLWLSERCILANYFTLNNKCSCFACHCRLYGLTVVSRVIFGCDEKIMGADLRSSLRGTNRISRSVVLVNALSRLD